MRGSTVSLTRNIWTSDATEGYICLAAHYMTKNWQLEKKLLTTRIMEERHTGVNIAKVISDLTTEFGLQKRPDRTRGRKPEPLDRLTGMHFPDNIPAKEGAKRAQPMTATRKPLDEELKKILEAERYSSQLRQKRNACKVMDQNLTSNSATSFSISAISSSSAASTQSSNIPSVGTASISYTSSAEPEEVISGYTVERSDKGQDVSIYKSRANLKMFVLSVSTNMHAQLEAKITHFDSFSKAATLLFRKIFTEEEYVGKTLTVANGKPSVDQHKLNIIYMFYGSNHNYIGTNNIVKNRFPYLTTAIIRLKLIFNVVSKR
ncbi:hypothetical protein KUTeg_009889 [Tegillarca granosa]|uniref:BEN domain-containing protein n=1 Tax=Tegillarca granosa TaxID=220873 RepID=A0ABQ9F570_TEGGR|nr:hypothetical protein KUTeg_009889 [Tegillarca granosa]